VPRLTKVFIFSEGPASFRLFHQTLGNRRSPKLDFRFTEFSEVCIALVRYTLAHRTGAKHEKGTSWEDTWPPMWCMPGSPVSVSPYAYERAADVPHNT
jgi:hypothetical protein